MKQQPSTGRFYFHSEDMKHIRDRLSNFDPSQFQYFPAFSWVRSYHVPIPVVKRLIKRSGLKSAEVTLLIPRIFTILPLEEVEKYIVHDSWGHGWQENLLQFEGLFQKVSKFNEPIKYKQDIRPYLITKNGKTILDKTLLKNSMENTMVSRIPAIMAVVLGELLADVVEFKLISLYPDKNNLLPNSSIFRNIPTKLDLTLRDLKVFFELACSKFDSLTRDSLPKTKLIKSIEHDLSVTSTCANNILESYVNTWQKLRRDTFNTAIVYDSRRDHFRANVFTRLALNMIAVHGSVINVYKILEHEKPDRTLPIKSFRDLIVLSIGVFFEEDPKNNFWKIDEFLLLRFLPLCRKFIARTYDKPI